MRLTQRSVVLLGLATRAIASPDPEKAQTIKEAYQYSWKGYYNNAFPNDTLTPLDNSYVNDRCVRPRDLVLEGLANAEQESLGCHGV